MTSRVRVAAVALISSTALLLTMTSANAALVTSLTVTDPPSASDSSWQATNDATGADAVPPADGTVMDLRSVQITTNRAARTMTINVVTNEAINSTTCVRTGGRVCGLLLAFRGVNTTTGALTQYSYELAFQPLLGVTAQHPRVESLASAFTRDFTVKGVSTWSNHFSVIVSTADFPDARLRPYLTVDSAHGSTVGAFAAVRSYFINSAHDTATFVDFTGQSSLPDVLAR